MGRQEHGDPFLLREAADFDPESRPALDVEARGRLVEEEDARPVHERQRKVKSALHPSGVTLHLAIGRFGQPDPGEQLVASFASLFAGDPVHRRLQPEMLASGQKRIERGLLQCRADRLPHLRSFRHDVVTRDRGGARRRRQQRREHVDGRGLAGAVRAEEAVDLTRVDA